MAGGSEVFSLSLSNPLSHFHAHFHESSDVTRSEEGTTTTIGTTVSTSYE